MAAFREVNKGIQGRNFTPGEMGVLFSVATHAHPDGTRIFPGGATIADETGADRKTVTKALKAARDQNVMRRIRNGNSRKGVADEYRLVEPRDWRLRHQSRNHIPVSPVVHTVPVLPDPGEPLPF